MSESTIVLGIDTCGPTGSAALARLTGGSVEILGQTELEGRSYSATLLAAIAELLEQNAIKPRELAGIVVVNGPGSFTGVRIGLGTAKGLAEGADLPMMAVSRLEVLAAKAETPSAALDAHRHEIFLRLGEAGQAPREMLAGAAELAVAHPAPERIAVCDEAAQALLKDEWALVEQVCTEPPTAADALRLCAPRLAAGEHDDVALLDGHYLRRSDAEIFGEPATATPQSA